MNEIINLRLATIEDADFLLYCRNDDRSRKSSYNTKPIDMITHIVWLKNILSKKDSSLYIAEILGNSVATAKVDFMSRDGKSIAYLSWTVASEHRGKGICKLMMKKIINNLPNITVYAEIKKDNASSIKVAEAIGLSFQKEENNFLHYISKSND